ncbi:FMN-dependent NADH-azoreductase [Chitinophaga japonensis]|uniref:FMN dependent NADH:quinone oxidoreductase n=1 Tax=Chitinophaga japonensis TaxID=104662 RepID=A0A562SYT1_CHIJA|nr:NAD(P)H-dependent oxidoreductase [Chitinophaga japonensis]TWI86479.1 FMN-dependent NADH-azoreductase [Chitinophaga japonensis]
MKKILNIISSPKGSGSYSIQLADALIGKLTAAYPGSKVQVKNLAQQAVPHLEAAHLAAFFTPEENYTPENRAAIRDSNEAIAEIMDADILVIGAPIYNFNIPSTLKAWLDQIVRQNLTFRYTGQGTEGLVKNKKAYIVIASGWVYSEGAMQAYNFVAPYLQYMLGFLGITDTTVVHLEGVALPGFREAALEEVIDGVAV